MSKTWIAVAHRGGARVIESTGTTSELSVVRDFDHPEGRLHAGEIDTDRPGESISSTQTGPHPMGRSQSPTERVADDFARAIAAFLDAERTNGSFDRLVLVAAPRFLGRLRDALPRPTQAMVVASLDKNLADAEPETIRQQLEGTQLV
jgi:protein required for attachment to host cells